MKIVLLGKTGQVGSALFQAFAPTDEIIAPSRTEADLERADELLAWLTTVRPHVIVNAAAYTAVDSAEVERERARAINETAVARLANFAADTDAWLVHYSSDYVFDGQKPTPYVETDAPRPLNFYGESKLAGDRSIELSGCKHLIFRVCWVYGHLPQHFPATILRLAKSRSVLNIVSDQIGAPTDARLIADVTAGTLHALAHAPDGGRALSGLYHLAPAGVVTRAELARYIVREALALGADLQLQPEAITPIATANYPTPAARPLNSRLDTTKIRQALGLDLPDWSMGIRKWITGAVAEMMST